VGCGDRHTKFIVFIAQYNVFEDFFIGRDGEYCIDRIISVDCWYIIVKVFQR
jgi:hypothetical protein